MTKFFTSLTFTLVLIASYGNYCYGQADTGKAAAPKENVANSNPGQKVPPKVPDEKPKVKKEKKNYFELLKTEEGEGKSEYKRDKIEISAPETVLAKNRKRRPRFIYANLDVIYRFKRKNRKGRIKIKLHHMRAPRTVKNFVDLATGEKEFDDIVEKNKKKKVKRPFYDGLKFHRIIRNFMIQTGCLKGDGSSGPGYVFPDEFHPELLHNRPGVVAMANYGPNTNGSQFYIALQAAPDLNKKNTVFGQVIKGMDYVEELAKMKTRRQDNKPRGKAVLKKVTIEKVY